MIMTSASCFPVEVRVAAADDIWLSTGYQRDNAYIAMHQYHRLDHRRYFAAFEAIVAEHQGRPHWGKLHSLDAEPPRSALPALRRFPPGAGPTRPRPDLRQ